jgi:hypothetical protein
MNMGMIPSLGPTAILPSPVSLLKKSNGVIEGNIESPQPLPQAKSLPLSLRWPLRSLLWYTKKKRLGKLVKVV